MEAHFLVDVSDTLFFLPRGGEGEVQGDREGGGVGFLLKIPRGGGVSPREGGGARGLGGCLQRFWGAKIFFFGAETPAKISLRGSARVLSEKLRADPPQFFDY